MSLYQGILLGLVQGLTEFLPVSSTGHLVIVQRLIRFDGNPVAADALLHLGTLVAVVLYFRRELALVAGSVFKWATRRGRDRYTVLAFYLLVATIPGAAAGAAFEKFFSAAFESVTVVGLMLITTGVILWLAESVRPGEKTLESLSLSDSLLVGLAQTLAIMPGLSRSGATIAAGIWRGFDRREAAKFSFLLSVPIIAGAAGFELAKTKESAISPYLLVGTVVAGLSGWLAIGLLIKMVQEQRLRFFSVYCFIVGSLALALGLLNR